MATNTNNQTPAEQLANSKELRIFGRGLGLSPEEVDELVNNFKDFDKDGSATVSRDELEKLFSKMLRGSVADTLIHKWVNASFQKADTNNNNDLDILEFLKLYSSDFVFHVREAKKQFAKRSSSGSLTELQKKELAEQAKQAKQAEEKTESESKKVAEEKAKKEAEEKANKEKAKKEAEEKEKAKKEAEEKEKAKKEAEEKEKAKKEAEQKEKAKKEAEEKAKREAEEKEKAKKEAEEKAKREAEEREKAKKEAEEKAKKEAEAKKKVEEQVNLVATRALGSAAPATSSGNTTRTVIYVRCETKFGEYVFLRGGVPSSKKPIRIAYRNLLNKATARAKELTWDKPTGGDWTTRPGYCPFHGPERHIGALGYGNDPENKKGNHYWKFDFDTPELKTGDWLEFRAELHTLSGAVLQERTFKQAGAPADSPHHFARVGYITYVSFGDGTVETSPL